MLKLFYYTDEFCYSHQLSTCRCIDIVRRNYDVITSVRADHVDHKLVVVKRKCFASHWSSVERTIVRISILCCKKLVLMHVYIFELTTSYILMS